MRLSEFIRAHSEEILAEWTNRVRALEVSSGASTPALIDHVPVLLTKIADAVDSAGGDKHAELEPAPRTHALQRLGLGFDLRDVAREYSLLRQSIGDLWSKYVGDVIDVNEVKILNETFDCAVEEAVVRYAEARERTLRAVNGIAEAAIEADDLETFLRALIAAMLRSTESVDIAAVLLVVDGRLQLSAAVGLDEEVNDFSLAVGEGFAGKIAATGEPLAIRDAANHPIVRTDSIRTRGVNGLYGVPLVYGGRVIGVAYIGSRRAAEFSEDDKLLFRTMASRAASGIAHAQAVAERRRVLAERTELLHAAREAEQRLRVAIEAADLGTWDWDPGDRKLNVSSRVHEMLGLDPSERDPSVVSSLIEEEDLETARKVIADAFGAGRSQRFHFVARIRRANDNARRTLDARGIALCEGDGYPARLVGTVLDVTDRDRAESQQRFLAESTALFASSLDYEKTLEATARAAVPTVADWCTVTLVARTGLEQVAAAHIDEAKIELARALDRRHPINQSAEHGVAAVVRTAKPELAHDVSDEELANLVRNEEQLGILRELGLRSYMIVPMIARGTVLGAIRFVSSDAGRLYSARDFDLAQQLAGRAALAIDNARLYEESRRATRLREDVLAVVSHDLKNPLMAVDLSARQLATAAVKDERMRRTIDTIQRAAGRMQRLIADLLDVAGIQAGRLTVEQKNLPATELVNEALESYAPIAAERGISLRAETAFGEDVIVFADRQRIHQVLANLLGNAFKFGRPGDSVTVAASLDDGEVVVSVADTGPGIAPESLPFIFDAYWSAKAHSAKGTGLGLFIAKGIVAAHGGRIWAKSELGRGSTFCFALPRS